MCAFLDGGVNFGAKSIASPFSLGSNFGAIEINLHVVVIGHHVSRHLGFIFLCRSGSARDNM